MNQVSDCTCNGIFTNSYFEKMPGKRLNSRAQEFVINLIEYFEMEKINGGPFQPISSVQERVATALKISVKTVCSLKKSKENIPTFPIYYNNYIGRDGYGEERVLSMWKKELENCSANVRDNCVRHTEKIIEDWFTRERNLVNIHIEPVIINTGEGSSDSKTNEL